MQEMLLRWKLWTSVKHTWGPTMLHLNSWTSSRADLLDCTAKNSAFGENPPPISVPFGRFPTPKPACVSEGKSSTCV